MVTISRGELDRIISSVEGKKCAELCAVSRREQLKHISDTRVAGWRDTLAAKRKAKLDWKAEKEKLEEEQRKIQDAEESLIHENQRREILGHAERLIREQTERMRQFRSQQILLETLEVRDAQVQERDLRRKISAEQDMQSHLKAMNSKEETEKMILEKLDIEKRKSSALAKTLKEQREERHEQIRLQQVQKRTEEDLIIQKIAFDNISAKQTEMQVRNERKLKMKEDMKANESLLKSQREQRHKEEEQLKQKCEEESRQQNRINAARLALEKKHLEDKITLRKLISDKAAEDLKQRAILEFEIFEHDQKMRNQKNKEKEEAGHKKQEHDKMEIDYCRRKQIEQKKVQGEIEKELSKSYTDKMNNITIEQQRLEYQKELAKREQNVKFRLEQQWQSEEIAKKKKDERITMLYEEQKIVSEMKKENDMFKDFVMQEIENLKVQGKRTSLLERTLISL